MAYGDYGGYAFRNGERVRERSDYTIMTDGTGFVAAGCHPGLTALVQGHPRAREIGHSPHYHAVLGDGPIMVGLYKQSTVRLHRGYDELSLVPLCSRKLRTEEVHIYMGIVYPNSEPFLERDEPALFDIEGHRLEVRWQQEDNRYVYARLTQPDGTVWTGFYGYGVGAGLEECGYGFSTQDRIEQLKRLFPEAPK